MHGESGSKGDLVKLTDGTATEADARRIFEGMRWPKGVRCPLPDCGGSEVYRLSIKGKTLKSGRVVGPRELYKCKACRRQFSVTKGTIFEDSHIPLRTWLVVMYRMCSSKKSVSARQIEREFGLSHRAAWFMCHRIRWAMTDKKPPKLRGTVEADETYIGGKPRGHRSHRKPRSMSEAISAAWAKKTPVFGMVERGGRIRAKVMPHPTQADVEREIFHGVDRGKTHLMTDGYSLYNNMSKMLPHDVIRHESEYVRGEVHTQNIESFWAVLKRGLIGTYHHVDAAYLHQYVGEYEFRHNTRQIKDVDRFMALASQTDGRLDWYVGDQAAS